MVKLNGLKSFLTEQNASTNRVITIEWGGQSNCRQ
jgi:hypothetical protein